MTNEELLTKIDEAHAQLVEEYGALAPSKEDFGKNGNYYGIIASIRRR